MSDTTQRYRGTGRAARDWPAISRGGRRRFASTILTGAGGRTILSAACVLLLVVPGARAQEPAQELTPGTVVHGHPTSETGDAQASAAFAQSSLVSPFDEVEHIPRVSPFAAANDPNASDEGLYVVQSDIEDAAAAAAAANGVLKPNGKPVGNTPAARKAKPTRFFVDPSARIAFSKTPMPYLTMSAYAAGGTAFFEKLTEPTRVPFDARSGSLNGGVSASANLGFINTNLSYDHSQPYKDFYTSRAFPGDGVGATFSKTLPLFVPNLVINPSLSLKRAIANPVTGLTDSASLNLGFSYKVTKTLELSIAPNYGWTFNTELPGYRRNNGFGTVAGITYKPLPTLIVSAAVATGFAANYGVPVADRRRNLNDSPTVKVQEEVTSMLSLVLQAGYGETWSNFKPANSYKYNVVPSVAMSIPL